MAIFGWCMLLFFTLLGIGQAFFLLLFVMPKYDPISGSETRLIYKVITILLCAALVYAAYTLYTHVPFQITIRPS